MDELSSVSTWVVELWSVSQEAIGRISNMEFHRENKFWSPSLGSLGQEKSGERMEDPAISSDWTTRFSSVQLLSCVCLFATLWTAAHQASLSITNSQSLPKLMSIESVMSSNHLILCRPLLLLLSIFPSTRVFSNESVLHIKGPKLPRNNKGTKEQLDTLHKFPPRISVGTDRIQRQEPNHTSSPEFFYLLISPKQEKWIL